MLEKGAIQFRVATGMNPGAIAMLEVVGADVNALVDCGLIEPVGKNVDSIGVGALVLCRFRDAESDGEVGGRGEVIDTGLVGRVNEEMLQLMPHGGPRVVRRLTDALLSLGAEMIVEREGTDDGRKVRRFWPEAGSDVEALMLATLGRAASREAVDLLLAQPRLWEQFRAAHPAGVNEDEVICLRERARFLGRLLVPPMVVLNGAANVGKSTLTNALAGRASSIASERAGTTRDYVGVLIELGGLTVWWYDTPGRREAGEGDAIDAEAERIADLLRARADLVIEAGGPAEDAAEGEGVLRVVLKSEMLAGADDGEVLRVSAETGAGMNRFAEEVGERLVPRRMREAAYGEAWLFCEELLGNRPSASGTL